MKDFWMNYDWKNTFIFTFVWVTGTAIFAITKREPVTDPILLISLGILIGFSFGGVIVFWGKK